MTAKYEITFEYIYIEREFDYGTLQSTKTLCDLGFIFKFKSEIIDSNRSI
jgi:hypothetical protein